MGFYEDRRQQAYDSLAKRGALVQLKTVTGEVFDAATGGLTAAGSVVLHETYGVMHPTKKTKKDASGVERRLWNVWLAALKPGGTVMPEPNASMTLVVGGLEYEIAESTPLRPGGVDLLYEMAVVR